MSEDPAESERAREAEQYKQRMQRRKARIDARVAAADQDRGVLLVLTGSGKGKSSSAFGMLARALGHGMRCGVVQFIKGTFSTGEEAFFRRFTEVRYHVMGQGFTWETQDRERDIRAAAAAWEVARTMLTDAALELVVLDELNIALKHGYVPLAEVIAAARTRPPRQHVVITGRTAPAELIEVADTVTDMRVVKHAFSAGVRAQRGIEL
jgi:cob(I)alamin adenosyltransferase